MKDGQVKTTQPGARIPILSPVIHVISMTVVVFLRRGFGYDYLRPKAIFISLIWALFLYTIYARHEPPVWIRRHALIYFAWGAVILYTFHFVQSYSTQIARTKTHDLHSGDSWLSTILGATGLVHNRDVCDRFVQLWLEPTIILLASVIAKNNFPGQPIGLWLLIAAASLWLKEYLNYWHTLRKGKKRRDILEDAKAEIEETTPSDAPAPSGTTGTSRTSRIPRRRASDTKSSNADLEHHAAVLRMLPPYTLEQAEENFRKLIKTAQPDTANDLSSANELTRKLTEAVEWFRGSS